MFYSNVTLREYVAGDVLKIKPQPEYNAFQPAGIDLKLDDLFLIPPTPERNWLTRFRGTYILQPGEAVLGCTLEKVYVPPNMLMLVHGKSSLGRIFLSVHQTAGLVDPGFNGRITLEFVNNSKLPIHLIPGMYICQVTVAALDHIASPHYGSGHLGNHYQGQQEVTPSHYEQNLEIR